MSLLSGKERTEKLFDHISFGKTMALPKRVTREQVIVDDPNDWAKAAFYKDQYHCFFIVTDDNGDTVELPAIVVDDAINGITQLNIEMKLGEKRFSLGKFIMH